MDELSAALRQRGLRVTSQRRDVLAAVQELEHATADQVCAHVQRSSPTFSLSTVYRTLELLEEIGLVSHAHLDHAAPTYHSTADHEHVHVVCRSCGSVQPVSAQHGRALASALAADIGFVTDVAHLAVHGTCASCAGQPARRIGKREASP